MKVHFLGFGLIFLALSCRSTSNHVSSGDVNHVVLMWLKDPSDQAVRQKIIDASETFRQIPGVLDVHHGIAVPSTRPIVDSSFDIGFLISFNDRASLDEVEQRAGESQPNSPASLSTARGRAHATRRVPAGVAAQAV